MNLKLRSRTRAKNQNGLIRRGGGGGGGMYETHGSRSEVDCLDFTLASSFKRNFEFFVKVIPQSGKPTKL